MIPNLPGYISILFGITTLLTLLLLYWALRNSSSPSAARKAQPALLALILWLILQASLAFSQVYHSHLEAMPPRLFLFGLGPALLLIAGLFLTKGGRAFLDSLPLKHLTMLSVVRVPVEIVLFLLYVSGAVPKLMTFEGGNLDILSGLTAPLIAWLAFRGPQPNRKLLIIWNFACLALLIHIVTKALLAAPFPFQKLAFDQPNIAILYFPVIWLPTFVVPAVLLAQLTAIRQLLCSTPAKQTAD